VLEMMDVKASKHIKNEKNNFNLLNEKLFHIPLLPIFLHLGTPQPFHSQVLV
jgi:hypothetical protein